MVAKEQDKKEVKKYKCSKCGKEVTLDDYNGFYQICINCEKNSGNSLMR